MRIVVDQDEVLAQFVEEILKRWYQKTGVKVNRSQINMWAMENTLAPAAGVNLEETKEWIERTIATPGVFSDLEPFPGAIDGFNRLLAAGHEVVIATHILAGNDHVYDDKRHWLAKHFPHFDLKNFFAISRKEWIDADILIDDGAHNLEAWVKAGRKHAVVFDAPWNQSFARDQGIRVWSWDDVLSAVSILDMGRRLANDLAGWNGL